MTTIKIFSLNCFGVPLAPNRSVRLKLIPNFILKTDPDFVMLQEITDADTYKKIRKNLNGKYHFYPEKSGLINTHGGLVFLSKAPLKNYNFFRYSISSGPYFPFSVAEGLIRKGIQICYSEIAGHRFVFLHTHLLASLFNKAAEYKHIKSELKELIDKVNSFDKGEKIVVGGDLNFPPENELYPYLMQKTGLKDPLANKNVFTSVRDNLNVKSIVKKFKWGNKREDYTLIKGFGVSIIKQTICSDRINYEGRAYDLSDHYGLLTTIKLK